MIRDLFDTFNIDHKNLYRIDKENNTVFIDVDINFYREIYNEWDFAPYINRDLDDDLFEYLENCAEEIAAKYNLCIVFHVPEEIRNPEKEANSVIGFKNYFRYQVRKLKISQQKLVKRMLLHAMFGIILIYSANLLNGLIPASNVFRFLVEGLVIGGWVLFWDMFSTLFFKQSDARAQKKILYRLCNSQIVYEYKKQTADDYKQHFNSLDDKIYE